MEEFSHDLGNPAPPWLDKRVQDTPTSQINQYFYSSKYNSSLPGVASWKGRVATHDEADQQSENDKFCLTPHVVLIVR